MSDNVQHSGGSAATVAAAVERFGRELWDSFVHGLVCLLKAGTPF